MLKQEELQKLYSLISNDSITFEEITKGFKEQFDGTLHMKVSHVLIELIKNNLITIIQKISAFVILNLIQKELNDLLNKNYLTPFLLECFQTAKNKSEKRIISDILENKLTYTNITTKLFVEDSSKNINERALNLPLIHQNFYEQNQIKSTYLRRIDNDKIRPILFEKQNVEIEIENKECVDFTKFNCALELGADSTEANYLLYLPADFCSDKECGENIEDEEPFWFMPNFKHNFLWEKEDRKPSEK